MPISRGVFIALLGTFIFGASAIAQGDPIAERRALMRDAQKQERAANNIILGKFLPEKAAVAMQRLQADLVAFVELFPVGSETGGETKADPAIWANMDDFRAIAARTIEDARAAEAAIAEGQSAFATAWQAVAEDCSSCHKKYTPTMMIR
jgi:cytochrome c556